MADKYKAILEELCRTALNVPAGELQTLISKTDDDLTDDDVKQIGDVIKGKYRDVVTSINKSANLKLDEKFNAGQRKKAEEFESLLREKFNVESDKQGAELVDDIVNTQAEQSKKNGKDLTEQEIKKHPVFIKAESELKKELNRVKEESTKQIETLKADQSRKEILSKVKQKALEEFDALNPVLSEDPARAAAQRNLVLEKIESYDFQEVDGDFIPVDKEGKRVEDEFHHAVDLSKLVKDIATPIFDFRVAEKRESPNGSESKPGNDGGGTKDPKDSIYKGRLPKTQDDYVKMMDDPNIPIKDKQAINLHWAKQTVKS